MTEKEMIRGLGHGGYEVVDGLLGQGHWERFQINGVQYVFFQETAVLEGAEGVDLELESRELSGGFAVVVDGSDGNEGQNDGTLIRTLFPEMDRVGLGRECEGALMLGDVVDEAGGEDEGDATDRDGKERLKRGEGVRRIQIGPTPDLGGMFEAAGLVRGFDVHGLVHFRKREMIEEENDGFACVVCVAPFDGMRTREVDEEIEGWGWGGGCVRRIFHVERGGKAKCMETRMNECDGVSERVEEIGQMERGLIHGCPPGGGGIDG